MSDTEDNRIALDDDHRAAYIFNPGEDGDKATRPSKRRKVAKKEAEGDPVSDEPSDFVPLFNGAERAAAMRCREKLFEASWSRANSRIQDVLRKANLTTLEDVDSFVRDAPAATDKIPAAFIMTGPDSASNELLFEQLSERLNGSCQGRFVRIRSGEAPNLKATLKKIIRDATSRDGPETEDDVDVAVGHDGRKYLDYDLEALYVFVKPRDSRRVIVAFEDGEAFDSGLLCDLISLFHSWKDRIPFTLLLGIATSVDLFQARLLRSTCQQLYGGQFDVAQSTAILDSLVKCAVGSTSIGLRIGPSLLRSLVERQTDQVAGIQIFISSLKYAHMCYFYANPLAIFLDDEEQWRDGLTQPEHLEALRSLPSFRRHIEGMVDAGQTDHVLPLLEDDDVLLKEVARQGRERQDWAAQMVRALHLIASSGVVTSSFTELYISALAEGIDTSPDKTLWADAIRRMSPDEIISLTQRLRSADEKGDSDLALDPGYRVASDDFSTSLSKIAEDIEALQGQAEGKGNVLRSQYAAQSKVLRTTVVAQKVQLSKDSANLTAEDKDFTRLVDELVGRLSRETSCGSADGLFLNEIWLYDSRAPYKDVFIPRPGAVLERALSRPHDYLACSCCGDVSGGGEGSVASLPPTSILYNLYQEAGALVNVADLWSAFYAVVGEKHDERAGLVLFYRALAELRLMGFVKSSKKKADHIAKVKWL